MKKLKLFPNKLEIRDKSLALGNELRIIKVSFEEAMRFVNIEDWNTLIKKYGAKNILKEREYYDGYVVVYEQHITSVVRMNGYLEKESNTAGIIDNSLIEKIEQGKYYRIVYPCKDGGKAIGRFKYVWTFMDCSFASCARDSEFIKRALNGADENEIEARLKEKLVDGLLGNWVVSLSKEENIVLKGYLGCYYEKFFVELED